MDYPRVLNERRTIARALFGASLARFGDGELKLALGAAAKSQAADPALRSALARVLRDTTGPCLPCIPRMDPASPKAAFWAKYQASRYTQLYDPAAAYGSAFVTRPDSSPGIDTPAYWEAVIDLWRGRDVVLVRGSTKSLTAERLTGANSVEEIVGPVQHAWAEVDGLFARLAGEVARPVILCLGATATVLAWRLAHEGVHALDLGHIGMFLRRRGADGRTGLDYDKGETA